MKKFEEHQAKSSSFKKESTESSNFDVDCNIFTGYEEIKTLSDVLMVSVDELSTTIFMEKIHSITKLEVKYLIKVKLYMKITNTKLMKL